MHSDQKSGPLEELDIIISIPECDDISTCNSEHPCDRLGPHRFIDVGRRHFQEVIFRTLVA
jgi:hypothetical protein